MTIRLLAAADAPALEAFLRGHRDSSMILRSNVRWSGLDYHPAAFHGQYVAAFNGDAIVSVVAHAWNGMLLVQAPEQAAEVARVLVALSGRKVTGLLGPRDHVTAVREALGLAEAATQAEHHEKLMGLDLDKIALPWLTEPLVDREFRREDRATLIDWRVAYDIETMASTDGPELRAAAAGWVDWLLADGTARVVTRNGELVSMAAFNARLPDMVQLGGVYTPPELRRRHYARAAVAAALLASRDGGVQRAVLFAHDSSALTCYESLGFAHIGEFSLVTFA